MSTAKPPDGADKPSNPTSLPRSLMDCLYAQLDDVDSGGAPVLIGNFHAAGLGDIIDSWAGAGVHLPVTSAQIQRVMGKSRIQRLADAANLSPAVICDRLVELLPLLINKLSRDGKLPGNKT